MNLLFHADFPELSVQAGFVHGDLRGANTACNITKQSFFLLDLETVAPADQVPGFHLTTWGGDVLQGNQYGPLSDLRMLSKMMLTLRARFVSSDARSFLAMLIESALISSQLSASSLLQHPWISCSRTGCRAAGAHPSDL